MGTAIHVELWSEDPALARRAIDAVMAEMHRIDRLMSPFKPESELSLVNREAAKRAVPIGAEMFGLIERSLAFSRLSDGAFDITYAGVGHLYDYRQGIAPDAATLQRARQTVGWQQLVLDAKARTIRFARDGVRIDLGGFAKGHVVDNSITILKRLGIAHAVVAAGGDSHVMGDRRGRPWSIAIRDPRDPKRVVAVLPLQDTSISTSGVNANAVVRNAWLATDQQRRDQLDQLLRIDRAAAKFEIDCHVIGDRRAGCQRVDVLRGRVHLPNEILHIGPIAQCLDASRGRTGANCHQEPALAADFPNSVHVMCRRDRSFD